MHATCRMLKSPTASKEVLVGKLTEFRHRSMFTSDFIAPDTSSLDEEGQPESDEEVAQGEVLDERVPDHQSHDVFSTCYLEPEGECCHMPTGDRAPDSRPRLHSVILLCFFF